MYILLGELKFLYPLKYLLKGWSFIKPVMIIINYEILLSNACT